MRKYVVQHSLAKNFQLLLIEVPTVVRLIEDNWPAWPMRLPLIDGLYYRLTNAMFRWADKHNEIVAEIPIDRSLADVIDKDWWSWLDDDDEEN